MNRRLSVIILPCGLLAALDSLPDGDNTRGAKVGKFCPITHLPLDAEAAHAVAPHSFDRTEKAAMLEAMLEQIASYDVLDLEAGPLDFSDTEGQSVPVTVDAEAGRERHNDNLPDPSAKPIDLGSQGV